MCRHQDSKGLSSREWDRLVRAPPFTDLAKNNDKELCGIMTMVASIQNKMAFLGILIWNPYFLNSIWDPKQVCASKEWLTP